MIIEPSGIITVKTFGEEDDGRIEVESSVLLSHNTKEPPSYLPTASVINLQLFVDATIATMRKRMPSVSQTPRQVQYAPNLSVKASPCIVRYIIMHVKQSRREGLKVQ